MFTTAMLLLALLTGVEDPRPLPAEAALNFTCRTRLQPQARRCVQACADLHADAAPRWDCVAGCTTRALDDLAECRRAPAATSAATAGVAPASASSLARR